jgi:hypothetical protein
MLETGGENRPSIGESGNLSMLIEMNYDNYDAFIGKTAFAGRDLELRNFGSSIDLYYRAA